MFCSTCGTKAVGPFCAQCGARIAAPSVEIAGKSWEEEARYEVLLQYPAVRDLIAGHAGTSAKGMSAERWMELCDKAAVAMGGFPVKNVALAAVPFLDRLGIRKNRARTERLPLPIGRVIVAAVCSLARFGRELKRTRQTEAGCILEAVLPSTIWSLQGELTIAVEPAAGLTEVAATVHIPGQLHDWGKATQALKELFDDLPTILTPRPTPVHPT